MGFKRVNIKELETILSQNFLGVPLKHIEKVIEQEKSDEKIQSGILKSSILNLFAEDSLEYHYDNKGKMKNFIGVGYISVNNPSNKDRIWDTRIKVIGTESVNLESEDVIVLGNLEPQSYKKVNYNVIKSDGLTNPIKITENIDVLNIERASKEESGEGQITYSNEIKKEYANLIKGVEIQLKEDQIKLEDVLKNVEEWNTKKREFESKVDSLEESIKSLINEKNKELESKLKKVSDDLGLLNLRDKSIYGSNITKSKGQIEVLEREIEKIEAESSKKITSTENEVNEEFNPQIEKIESKLRTTENKLDKATAKSKEWIAKKKELNSSVKNLNKELNKLTKELSKIQVKTPGEEKHESPDNLKSNLKDPESKLNKEQKKLDEAITNEEKWTTTTKELNIDLKNLTKELNSLNKEKSRDLSLKIKDITNEKKAKIKKIKKEIKLKELDITSTEKKSEFHTNIEKEVNDKYDPKIKSLDSKLNDEKSNLEETSKKFNEISGIKDKLAHSFKNLDTEYQVLTNKNPKTQDIGISSEEANLDVPDFVTLNSEYKRRKNYLLLFNKNNSLKFSITLENTTDYLIENIKLGKFFFEDFANFNCKSTISSEIKIVKEDIIWELNQLKSGEKATLTINTDIYPKEKKLIGTGDIQLSYEYQDHLISGITIKDFSAYSHALHAINIKEKEDEPYKWDCSLFFKNNSELNMELKSILVLDKEKQNNFLEFSSESGKTIITPGEIYYSDKWEVYNENEPKFFRKLEYSITHKVNKKSKINLRFEEKAFDIIDTQISKKFSKTEIKSFEEAEIENLINIKNTGSTDIYGISVEEVIPADFIPPLKLADINIRNSSGNINYENINLKIIPDDDDPSKAHLIRITIYGNNNSLINLNDFVEIRYNFKAVKPDFKVKYEFPIKMISYFPKYQLSKDESKIDYFKIHKQLNQKLLPELKVIHKRRNLIIGKSIFPGRDIDEFGISVIINNKSNVEINNIKITDTIPNSFELISSNIDGEISKLNDNDGNMVSFIVDSILPYQEKEIRYYLHNISGEDIGYEELESFIFG